MKFIFANLFLCVFSIFVGGQTAQPKTVTDFYLLLPVNLFATESSGKTYKSKADLEKFRRSIITIEDLKNGYLALDGYSEGWGEVAIFKKTDGTYLVGVAEADCAIICDGNVQFFNYRNDTWTDITTRVFPMPTRSELKAAFKVHGLGKTGSSYYFRLPRFGRTVEIDSDEDTSTRDETLLLEYEWNGERFTAKR